MIPLTVIMPAYNEEVAIRDAVEDVRRHVFPLVPGAELLVIDDGSRDRTGAILDEIATADPRVRVIHQPNGGHGAALRTGLDAATGEYVFLIDSDRQIDLAGFGPLWEKAKARDGAFGVRSARHDPRIRLLLTRLVRVSIRVLFGVRIYDANVPFKILRRSIWEAARDVIPPGTLAPSLFLAIFAKVRGHEIATGDIEHRKRQTGVVSIRRWKLVKFAARGFRQMVAFRRAMRK